MDFSRTRSEGHITNGPQWTVIWTRGRSRVFVRSGSRILRGFEGQRHAGRAFSSGTLGVLLDGLVRASRLRPDPRLVRGWNAVVLLKSVLSGAVECQRGDGALQARRNHAPRATRATPPVKFSSSAQIMFLFIAIPIPAFQCTGFLREARGRGRPDTAAARVFAKSGSHRCLIEGLTVGLPSKRAEIGCWP